MVSLASVGAHEREKLSYTGVMGTWRSVMGFGGGGGGELAGSLAGSLVSPEMRGVWAFLNSTTKHGGVCFRL